MKKPIFAPVKKVQLLLAICTLAFCLSQCTVESQNDLSYVENDPHSYSRPFEARTSHLELDLSVDFSEKILRGFARHTIRQSKANRLILDIRDLNIDRVTIGKDEKEVTFTIALAQEYLGSALEIPIDPNTNTVTVYYSTSPNAAALDWLDPMQTADKKSPFLYTQGQAILTRTWIPIQDSPGIRITYDATIRVPQGMMAVMSASNPQQVTSDGVYHFKMEQPIPAYLMALAVGNLSFGEIGPRTGIYAEPSVLESALYEMADMEKMVVAAEKLYGPYLWERFDVIILPPSFPFGGMENPRLTFATPTIIAGDRSLTSLIAHELAHSWSGNLVTNATWDDFWLNEGFTVYFERRIMEALYGKEYTDMLALLGYQDLEHDVEDIGNGSPDTHLHLDLAGRDPDEGMTSIPYEKGAFFLIRLEELSGRETFDDFLKTYFEQHRFQSMTTSEFVTYLQSNLIIPHNLNIDLEAWIFGPGIPADCPKIHTEKFEAVNQQVSSYLATKKTEQLTTENWSTHEWLHCIRNLPETLSPEEMESLDKEFALTVSGNSEILDAWFELAIRTGYSEQILEQIQEFLVHVGRRKFLIPLYKAFKETGKTEIARSIFLEARENYHYISAESIEKLLIDDKILLQ